MGAVPSSTGQAVPSAVAPSATDSVVVNKRAQRGSYKPMTGSSINPQVPRTQVPGEKDMLPNPGFGGYPSNGAQYNSGSAGAPSLPQAGYMFIRGPIDSHYTVENEGSIQPYHRVNSPRTRGMFTRLQDFANGIKTSQDVDNAGWRVRHAQQRTSHMRNQLPNLGFGYGPNWYQPRQAPQAPNTAKFQPVLGSDAYGTGVLNSDTYGAGQTAGGIGGNQYTPTPGPPDTTSTAAYGQSGAGAMPSWG